MNTIEKIKKLKPILEKDGFIIEGVFGSYARGEETPQSDVDLLYSLTRSFVEHYRGFAAFSRLEEIKNFLRNELGKEIDIAAKNGLSKTGKKYILKDLIDV